MSIDGVSGADYINLQCSQAITKVTLNLILVDKFTKNVMSLFVHGRSDRVRQAQNGTCLCYQNFDPVDRHFNLASRYKQCSQTIVSGLTLNKLLFTNVVVIYRALQ